MGKVPIYKWILNELLVSVFLRKQAAQTDRQTDRGHVIYLTAAKVQL